jgi:phage I-like protein
MMSNDMNILICREIDGVPSEIQIIPFGSDIPTEKGPFTLDAEAAAAIVSDFDSRKNDMVIDYEHQTLSGGEAPAAGWIKKLIFRAPSPSPSPYGRGDRGEGTGIWAAVEWTPRAVEYLKNKEYRYLSPVFMKRVSDNKVVRLINAALTNQPAIDGMVPVVNKKIPSLPAPLPSGEGGRRLGEGNLTKEVQMKKVLELLGLPETATEDEAAAALQAVMDKLKNAEAPVVANEVLDALGLKEGATASEVTGTALAMKQAAGQVTEMTALKTEIAAMKAAAVKKDAAEMVEAAMKEGKVTPAQRDWARKYAETDPEGFKVFVAKATVVVDMKEHGGGAGPASGGAMDETQRVVNKALGISEESFKQFKKKEGK